jgi:hypothetical protein
MPEKSGTGQIVVAVLGLVGVLGAALIAKWDKPPWSASKPQPALAQPSQVSDPNPKQPSIATERTAGAPREDAPEVVPKCEVSGTVFDSTNNQMLSAVELDVYPDFAHMGFGAQPLRSTVATTGADGRFSFDCGWLTPSQFTILLGARHPAWATTFGAVARVDSKGVIHDLNIPIALRAVDLKSPTQ